MIDIFSETIGQFTSLLLYHKKMLDAESEMYVTT